MNVSTNVIRVTISLLVLSIVPMIGSGCQTGGQSGALAGAWIGAFIGQAAGGDTKATLIGAAIGTGIGYIIGNEQDKQHAQTMSRGREARPAYTHDEIGPLGNTRWMLVSLAPRDAAPPYQSKIFEFRPGGRVITTTTNPDGSVDVFNERYRVVGNTLIVNKPGYLINARYDIENDEMIIDSEEFRAVHRRLRS